MSRRRLDSIFAKARREALPVVTAALRDALPPGWRCVLAVGWGVTVLDDAGRMVEAEASTTHGKSPHPMRAKLRKAVALAEHFGDLYSLGNEDISRR